MCGETGRTHRQQGVGRRCCTSRNMCGSERMLAGRNGRAAPVHFFPVRKRWRNSLMKSVAVYERQEKSRKTCGKQRKQVQHRRATHAGRQYSTNSGNAQATQADARHVHRGPGQYDAPAIAREARHDCESCSHCPSSTTRHDSHGGSSHGSVAVATSAAHACKPLMQV